MARATPGARTSDRTVSVAVVDAGRDVVVIGVSGTTALRVLGSWRRPIDACSRRMS